MFGLVVVVVFGVVVGAADAVAVVVSGGFIYSLWTFFTMMVRRIK